MNNIGFDNRKALHIRRSDISPDALRQWRRNRKSFPVWDWSARTGTACVLWSQALDRCHHW